MELTAIISDIHGNLDALEAVLKDVATTGATRIACLGDVVGYGPRPNECAEIVEKLCFLKILGNHDQAALSGLIRDDWNPVARSSMQWTQRVLNQAAKTSMTNYKRKDVVDGVLMVHASPQDPTHEYIREHDWILKKEYCLPLIPGKVCLCGHTHTPGLFDEDGGFEMCRYVRQELAGKAGKLVLNVGSVGQPRDGDPAARYMLLDGEGFQWRRVEYDVDACVKKMTEIGLHPFLGDRLRVGK
jgi:diadenosine tetraphosphatase ApaH/serine/threonine PP2A family protein phosphatase